MYWRLQFAKKNLHITGIRKVFFLFGTSTGVYNTVQTVQCFNDVFFFYFGMYIF